MHVIILIFYNIFIRLFNVLIRIVARWNPKAALWIKGRKGLWERMKREISPSDQPLVWFHCASLGEFEQGRPLIEAWRDQFPNDRILLTFFSSSGYEARKSYAGADYIYYLPMDSAQNADRFIDIVQPNTVIWVKYDYWYYYLRALNKRKIPVLLVSAIFWESMFFFKWYGSLHRKMLRSFSHIFVQNDISIKLLTKAGFGEKLTRAGDTRFDRVVSIANQFTPIEAVASFCGAATTIVAGSTWPEDEELLVHYIRKHPSMKCIIATHDIHAHRIEAVEQLFQQTIRYSKWIALSPDEQRDSNFTTLILDNIGMLSRIYHYATIAYVGGGFTDTGVHNVLEAAVHGKPVVWGPEYSRFHEATGLIDAGGGASVENVIDLEAQLDHWMFDDALRVATGKRSKEFVHEHTGATNMILQYIQENLRRTS